MKLRILAVLLCWCVSPLMLQAADGAKWYRGNTHTHSFWSDGDDFPEMVAEWYKNNGYDFLVMTEHGQTMEGEKWKERKIVPDAVIEKCNKRFGKDWVETRGEGKKAQVRMKNYDEVSRAVNVPGRFLLIQGQELNVRVKEHEVHACALNVSKTMPSVAADSAVATMRGYLQASQAQAVRSGRIVVTQMNHPSWPDFPITSEDMAQSIETRIFEVCNAAPQTHVLGDKNHASTGRQWDEANVLRIAKYRQPPLMGTATDDSHNYQKFAANQSNPGRGFVMVRAEALDTNALMLAMNRGDFYASTGVVLTKVDYDAAAKTLTIEVDPAASGDCTIDFVGTTNDYSAEAVTKSTPTPDGKFTRPVTTYSKDIGRVLKSVKGAKATYQLTGNELYVRAWIRSDLKMENPGEGEVQNREAWTQPVGWEKWLK